jgi:FKBP-type peptidyl-prolyl cis-trans isomerase FklB
MKIKQLLILSLMVGLISCGKTAITGTKVKSVNDSLSYAFGVNIYNSLLNTDSIHVNPMILAKAMLEAKDGKAFMDDMASKNFLMSYFNKREQAKQAKQAELNAEKFKSNQASGDSFLQKNKENPGVVVTASGLQYKVIKMGTGAKPAETDQVKVNYTGTFINGTKFDSSVDRGEPAEFQVNGVIKGWVEGLQLMPVGSKFMFYIPEGLAYGSTGAGEVIQPYSTLIFEVELLEILKK